MSNEKTGYNLRDFSKEAGILLAFVAAIAAVVSILFYVFFVTEIEQHEVGYKWDRRTGEISILPRSGYFIAIPWLVQIHGIDTRPTQVCINANNRVLNCKLVEFNKAGLTQFIAWHGLQSGTVSEILKSYAYDGQNKSYPFLTIKTELGAQPSGGVQ
jgi:hypothetical protein